MEDRRAVPRWHWTDLVTEAKTGRLSEARIWSNVGKCAMTFGFIWVIVKGTSAEFLWLAYGAIVVGHEVISKMQNQQQQKMDKPAQNSSSVTQTTTIQERTKT